jgi:hypothetical protein
LVDQVRAIRQWGTALSLADPASLSQVRLGRYVAATGTATADPRCQQLEALNRQYAGVSLTADQQRIKRQLLAWYNQNCRSRRASG